ncbi:MAG: leucine-rich repeat protein [Clostridia bacterium]|nr:leucine-rich repeat protein [Clostridia bacterium]
MKTTLQKRIISMILAVIVTVGMVPMTAIPAAAATTDDGLVYTITDGTVTITDYTGTAENLVIPDTIEGCPVTKIGDSAFYNCQKLISVDIPDGVTSIGESAFNSCLALTSVNIPDGVTSIGYNTFYYCRALTSIDIPDSVTDIGDSAFRSCSSLTEITLPQGLTSINYRLFDECHSLSRVDLPDSITQIGSSAFSLCKKLESIELPSSIAAIGSYAFSSAGLKHIDIPGSITEISYNAFSSCTALESVNIPNGVTVIGSRAFASCSSLTNIAFPDSVTTIVSEAFMNAGLTSVTIPETVTSLGSGVFYGCNKLESVTLPENLTTIPSRTFIFCSNLKSITIPDSVTTIGFEAFYDTGLTSVYIPESAKSIGYSTFAYCEDLSDVTISEGITEIPDRMFNHCSSLTEITLPQSTKTIGRNVFTESGIKSIVIPDGTTTIGYNAFEYCNTLESIEIPDSVTAINDYAFSHCTALKTIEIPSSVTSIASNTFSYSGLTSISLPESITTIGPSAFYSCSSLASVELPDSVTSIGANAFCYCSALTSINIPDSITSISTGAFDSCKALTSIELPDGIAIIAERAFYSCQSLESINIPESVTSIGVNALTNCKALTSIALPEKLQRIERYAFSGCASLTDVKIPDSVTYVGNNAFSNCPSLESITLPAGLTAIPEYMLEKCSSLTYIELPESITSIGQRAFSGCSSLTSIELPDGIDTIKPYTFDGCQSLESVYLPEVVTSIGTHAFSDCQSLTDITLPESVTSIGSGAFYGCSKLTTINIPEGITKIEAHTFNSSGITEIDIPETVTEIGDNAFYYCGNLTSIVIPEKITKLNLSVFGYCKSLRSITIPESVKRIENYAFYYCDNLSRVIYGGTEATWNEISIGGWNQDLTNAELILLGDHEHEYETTVLTEPTCTVSGSQYHECMICAYSYTDAISPLGHEYTSVVTPPDCSSSGYTTYSCIRCDHSYNDDHTAPQGHFYGDWIVDVAPTCTSAGSRYKECTVCKAIQRESLPQKDHEFTGSVIAPTCQTQGYTVFECTGCSYSYKAYYTDPSDHSYGDWIIDRAPTLLLEGEQHRVCAVCSYTETQKLDRISVDYTADPNYGLVNFTVVNAQSLKPIENAQIFITTESEGENTFNTDKEGKLSLVLPVGSFKISAYAEGCLVRNVTVNVKPGVNDIPEIGLSDLETYEAELKHHVMTSEEIEEAGIDTSDPANQHVYKYELTLSFTPTVDEIEFIYYVNAENKVIPQVSTASGGFSWISTCDGDGHFYGSWTDPVTGVREEMKVYPVSDKFYLIIRGEVQWLKEMFDVEMLIINNSMTDTLEDLTATLDLPEGLSLAAMTGSEQTLSQAVENVPGGESRSVHWYVRGDREGSYGIEARLQGMVMPFEEPIDDLFVSENELQVLAGNALHLHFEFPGAAYYNEDYPIKITLSNVSDRPLYYLSHMVQIVQGMEVYHQSGSSYKRIETSDWMSSDVIPEFLPGDELIMEISVNIFFKSDAMERELKKLADTVNGAEQFIRGYMAVNSAVDTTGSISVSVSDCRLALDTFISSQTSLTGEKLRLARELALELAALETEYSSGKNMMIGMATALSNTGIGKELDAISADCAGWMAAHSVKDISSVLTKVRVCEKLIDTVGASESTDSFDIFDSLRSAVSAIPVRFVLTSVIMTESADNTTSIPWSYTVTDEGPQYFGVSDVCEYLNSMSSALMESYGDGESPAYFRLVPHMDGYLTNTESVRYIKATESTGAKIKAKDATGEVRYSVYVVNGDGFTLSCDNETAVISDGVLSFTGDGMITAVPEGNESGTIRIEDSFGNVYDYVVDVVEEHVCIAGEAVIVMNPTEELDGFAVKRCSICEDTLEVITLSADDICTTHSFGEWNVMFESTGSVRGARERVCSVCAICETELLPLASTLSPDGFEYYIENGQVTITGYNGNDSEVTVPEYIEGHPVCYIGDHAFSGCEELVHIIIPSKVCEIGKYSFEGCTSLRTITLPDSTTQISEGAFMGCTSLNSIIFCSSVTSIGDKAFSGCDSLSAVYFIGKDYNWSTIRFGNDNAPLFDANLIFSAPGDVNGDGNVDGKDAFLMSRVLAGRETLEKESVAYLTADLDGDGSLTGKDMYIFKRIIAGSFVS